MEQLRQVGEVLGSLKALMIFGDDIKVNRRQCALLVDAFSLAFDTVADEIKKHLKFEEKLTKWKALENPLRELHRIFREGEQYVRSCLEPKDWWWGRAVALSRSTDCIELHLHNLLWCVPVVLEAVEAASEISGCDQEEMLKKRAIFAKKYDRDWLDPKLFEHEFGRLYLVQQDMCRRLRWALREDRWLLSEAVEETKRSSGSPGSSRKQESRLAELLLGPRGKLHPTSMLVGWPDYQVRRRLGSGSNVKEIQWMGESFAMRHVIGDIEQLRNEIDLLSSLAHPNVQSCMYAFSDEERKECFMVMELMSKDLSSHIREVCCARRRVPFPLLVAVDIMLQIARGMKYLHSKAIYHGNLNPSNVLVKSRSSSVEGGYMLVKIANFGLSPVKNSKPAAANQAAANPCIWYAPEVLSEQEQEQAGAASSANGSKRTEKADVYSFAMICFELLTGKVPFDESHLQGDKMSRNIKADVRPLFPFPSPKYLVSLTKRCWQSEPTQRPGFASICRMLRYVKRFLVLNPDNGQPDLPAPPLEYFDIEMNLSRRFPSWIKAEEEEEEEEDVSEIPFQMYAYRVVERERTSVNYVIKDRSNSDSGSEGASISGEENGVHASILSDDTVSTSVGSTKSSSHASSESNNRVSSARKVDEKTQKQTGQQKSRPVRPPQQVTPRGTRRLNSDGRTRPATMSPARRRTSGHASDSELSL